MMPLGYLFVWLRTAHVKSSRVTTHAVRIPAAWADNFWSPCTHQANAEQWGVRMISSLQLGGGEGVGGAPATFIHDLNS